MLAGDLGGVEEHALGEVGLPGGLIFDVQEEVSWPITEANLGENVDDMLVAAGDIGKYFAAEEGQTVFIEIFRHLGQKEFEEIREEDGEQLFEEAIVVGERRLQIRLTLGCSHILREW